jgi:hypothetical protein
MMTITTLRDDELAKWRRQLVINEEFHEVCSTV